MSSVSPAYVEPADKGRAAGCQLKPTALQLQTLWAAPERDSVEEVHAGTAAEVHSTGTEGREPTWWCRRIYFCNMLDKTYSWASYETNISSDLFRKNYMRKHWKYYIFLLLFLLLTASLAEVWILSPTINEMVCHVILVLYIVVWYPLFLYIRILPAQWRVKGCFTTTASWVSCSLWVYHELSICLTAETSIKLGQKLDKRQQDDWKRKDFKCCKGPVIVQTWEWTKKILEQNLYEIFIHKINQK